jgi:hypothetical protein
MNAPKRERALFFRAQLRRPFPLADQRHRYPRLPHRANEALTGGRMEFGHPAHAKVARTGRFDEAEALAMDERHDKALGAWQALDLGRDHLDRLMLPRRGLGCAEVPEAEDSPAGRAAWALRDGASRKARCLRAPANGVSEGAKRGPGAWSGTRCESRVRPRGGHTPMQTRAWRTPEREGRPVGRTGSGGFPPPGQADLGASHGIGPRCEEGAGGAANVTRAAVAATVERANVGCGASVVRDGAQSSYRPRGAAALARQRNAYAPTRV